MKRTLTFLFLIVITTSCMMPKYAVYSGMLDFKKYNDRGFFITQSNSVSFEYDPIGVVSVTVYSGMDENKETTQKKTSIAGPNMGKYHIASNEDAFDALYEKCMEENGNGIINVNFSTIKDKNGNIVAVEASGMAIRRK